MQLSEWGELFPGVSRRTLVAAGFICAVASANVATAQTSGLWGANAPARSQAVNSLKTAGTAPGGQAPRIETSKRDGTVRFLSAPANNPIAVPQTRSSEPAAAVAQNFVRDNATLFHEDDQKIGFNVERERSNGTRSYIRLGQTYGGVPVYGAHSTVQVANNSRGIEAVASDIMTVPSSVAATNLSLTPTLSASEAKAQVLQEWQTRHANVAMTANDGELFVFCPSVVGLPEGKAQLVWRFEVQGAPGSMVGDVVFWNAHNGTLSHTFPLIHNAMIREIYDANNSGDDPGTLILTESQSSTNIQDAKFAYAFFKNTYDFYFNQHGRDGIDDMGSTIGATVRYCPGNYCPYQNAHWDSFLNHMYFGAGFASADDVVGHELTHGVTQYTSGLDYFAESGAINESFSDIWGEWIDQTNNLGNDSDEVRWLMGEDLPGGAGRSMKDPTVFQNADRMGSPYWISDEHNDYFGVHYNSGVGNKLAYLLTDGGTFNGKTIASFGIVKTAQLYYEVQTNLLSSTSDYLDLYFQLTQAAINLNFSQQDKDNLEAACQAVEIHQPGPAPVNDNFADALDLIYSVTGPTKPGITLTGTGSTSGTNARATLEENEPTPIDVYEYNTTDSLVSRGECSVWWKFRTLGEGAVTIDTLGSTFDTLLTVYTGTTLDNLTTVALSNDYLGNIASRVVILAKPGENYYIAVTGASQSFRTIIPDDDEEEEEEEEEFGPSAVVEFPLGSYSTGMIKLKISGPILMPPYNDNLVSATTLPALSGTAGTYNFSATTESGEALDGGADGRSVWWKYVPYANGDLKLNTVGSNFDTVLNVYSGSGIGALTNIGSNNDISLIDDKSTLTVPVTKGTTYYIAVDGHNGAFGDITLNYQGPIPSAPSNDNFVNAIDLPAPSGSQSGTNVSASKEQNEPSHAGQAGGRSVWWKYTALNNGEVSINTQGSSFDTLLGVYTGSSVNALTSVASNNDNGIAENWSKVTFAAQKGQTYYIAVDGAQGTWGNVQLTYTGPVAGGSGGGGGTTGSDLVATTPELQVKKSKLKGKILIENIGIESAGKTSVDVYYSTDNTLDGSDILLKNSRVAKLKVNKAKKLKINAKSSLSWTGAYAIIVVDPQNLVSEQDENNNVLVVGPLS